jgi:hypothetical protein
MTRWKGKYQFAIDAIPECYDPLWEFHAVSPYGVGARVFRPMTQATHCGFVPSCSIDGGY